MKVNGMDAPTNYVPNNSTNDNRMTEIKTLELKEPKLADAESKVVSQITDYEKKELPISEKVIIDAIQKANRAISGANRKFEFSIHQKTKQIMVKVIDSDTGDVIREIPPEKTLDMVARMWEMAGILVDERR